MTIIKQSTARTILVGPVLDADGVAKTDEVVGNIRLSKNGGAPAAPGGAAALTHNHAGKYLLELIDTNASDVGLLQISLNSGTNDMPVLTLDVVEEAVYDAFFAADAVGIPAIPANWLTAAGIADNAIAAAKIAAAALNGKGDWNVGKDGYSLTAVTGLGNQTADITGTISTVTTLTNLPAITTDWLTAAGVSAAAVTKIQDGLATPTNITAGTITTVTTLTNLPAITAGWLTAAGIADNALDGKGDWTIPVLRTTIDELTTQTSFTLVAGSADNDAYNGCIAIITDQTTGVQKCIGGITDYVGATKTVTLGIDPAIFTMAAGDTVEIAAKSSIGFIAGEVTTPSAGVDLNADQSGVTIGTVTTLTNLPAITASWLTAAGIADNAITVDKIADNAISSTKIVAGDTGITLQKAMEMLAAFVAGKASRVSALGVTTITYVKRDGTTTSFTTVANEDDGDRDTTGALS